MAKVLIIEDEPFICNDLKRLVIKQGHDVVATCYNSDRALDALAKMNYDIVLLDIHIAGSRNGIQLAEIINEKYHKPFIYITSFADRDTIEKVKRTMPAGYVVKPFNAEDIYSSIEIGLFTAAQNKARPLTLEVVNKELESKMTAKEFEISLHIMEGLTNAQIAHLHFISENTVRSHIKSIFKKLDVHSRAEMATKISNTR